MAHRYPFIVTLSKPFYKYALNNSVIPFAYILFYLYQSAHFQKEYELIGSLSIVYNLLLFLAGVLVFVYLSFGFFYFLVKILPRCCRQSFGKVKKTQPYRWLYKAIEKDKEKKVSESLEAESEKGDVETYIMTWRKIARTAYYKHYTKEHFKRVFYYQHRNAFIYVLFILSFIILRGLIKDYAHLIIPAAASFQIMLTVTILIISMFYIVFRNWTFFVLSLVIVAALLVSPAKILSYNDNAYGLDYSVSGKKAKINPFDHGNFASDSLQTIQILDRWLERNTDMQHPEKKPKLVVVSTSGGGLKLAVWTYYALSYADSCLDGKLLDHTELMTGASGGMLGAAFVRELCLRRKTGVSDFHPADENLKNISKDILNPVFYTYSMSDWFFRLQKFRYANKYYFKDRAYMFEQTLNRNLGPVLDKPLIAYRKPEQEALVPMLVLSPAIENTGAQLIISPQNVSYLTKTMPGEVIRNMEFRYNYRAFNADSLRFLSAIRMNATFPYVSPEVNMPGEPHLAITDAGLSDNFGYITAFRFIVTFKEWIEKNTSGVVMILVYENDRKKIYSIHKNILYRYIRPMGSLFDDWSFVQKNNYLASLLSLNKMLPGKFFMVPLSFGNGKEHIALSWHLTKKEKQILLQNIHSDENKKAINLLRGLLDSE